MHIMLSGHHLDLTDALRNYVNDKLSRVDRLVENAATNTQVTLSIEKLNHKAEATLRVAGHDIHADAVEENMYAAIDCLADKIDRQVKKHLEKQQDKHRSDKVRVYEA